jgi:hypothetical protein
MNAQIAINASFYSISTAPHVDNINVAVSDGERYSKFSKDMPALNISKENVATIVEGDPTDPSGFGSRPKVELWNAVGGNEWILRHGVNVARDQNLHPRTAVGLTTDSRLLLLVVDGRNPLHSMGMKTGEVAAVLKAYGAVNAFNLDVGGSTTLVFADPTPRVVNLPVGISNIPGTERPVGTNLAIYAAPAGEEGPIVLDIAASMVAHGQIAKVGRRGEKIPLGWALDASGKPTTDPTAGYAGVLLPFGGHKGYGIGLLVDVLTGALAGSTIGRGVDQRNTNPETGGQSLFMLAIDVRHFVPFESYAARMDQLIREIHATPPAEGFAEVFAPGDIERRQESARRRDGIPVYPGDWESIVSGLESAGLPTADLVERFGPVEA